MNEIALVGTSHSYQLPDNEHANTFASFIRSVLDSSNFTAIAEEMSSEALSQKGASESICKQVADERGLRHLYSDPDSNVRNRLCIQGENDIRLAGFLNNHSNDEINRNVRASHGRREKYWLDGILALDCWPVLFVCGANHIDGFGANAKAQGLSPKVLVADWCP
jgi:hypothetical protein